MTERDEMTSAPQKEREKLGILRTFLRSALMVVFFTVVLGLIYPALVNVVGSTLFPDQAAGSLVRNDKGEVVGSNLLGEDWTDTGLFEGRPSATGEKPYNPMATSGSNYAQSNPDLEKAVKERAERWQKMTGSDKPVPMELLTASASGLDPQISLAGALYEVPWVAKSTGLSAAELEALVRSVAKKDLLAFGEDPLVNVLELNLKVLEITKKIPHQKPQEK